jgi:hypothetical protein
MKKTAPIKAMPPKKRKNAMLVSTWEFTLNSNRSQPEYRQKVIDVMNLMLNNAVYFLKYAPYFGSKDPDWQTKIFATKVHTFNVEQATGKDSHNNGWHVHALVGFLHNTRIHVNGEKTQTFVKEQFGYKPYFKASFRSDPRTVTELYHTKGGGKNEFVKATPTLVEGKATVGVEAKLPLPEEE